MDIEARAKETVIKANWDDYNNHNHHWNVDEMLELQAIQTAKILCPIAEQVGARKVVEWLLGEGGFPWSMDEYPERIGRWRAFLKEMGIL